ncbi:site-2 protease family protein [Devosia chinhatensis]|nr:site-2 protease family protein [Devosia chinhatensis]
MDTLTLNAAVPGRSGDDERRQAILRHRPRLVPNIRLGSVHRGRDHVYRAHDPLSGRTMELGPVAARILAQCDGTRSVAQLIEGETRHAGDQGEAARLVLACLEGAERQDLIRPLSPDHAGVAPRKLPGVIIRTLKNPLFARFSLFVPDPMIERLAWLARLCFSPWGAALWAGVVGFGAWLAIGNWDELFAYGREHALAPASLVWTLLLFPLVKLLHELGHALACKRWGGQVRDFGISLLVFIPIPFVDCSDSAFFPQRRQRILVAAAGMMFEFVIAVLALVVWVVATEPLVRLMAFNIVVMSTITTIVFNANPLLRYDAYYILCDLVGIDNLGTRAQAVINVLSRRLFLGDARAWPEKGRWHSALFVLYGVASFLYKCFIVVVVLVGIFPRFFIFGVVLALWGAITMVVLPMSKVMRSVFAPSGPGRKGQAGQLAIRAGIPIIIAGLFLAIPLPYAILSDGRVQVPPESVVRAGGNGFLVDLVRRSDVAAGAPLARLNDAILDAELASRSASLRAQQLRHDILLVTNLAQAAELAVEIGFLSQELAQQQANRNRLDTVATQPGLFTPAEGLRLGDFLREGDEIGLITPPGDERIVVTSLVQEDADLVRSRLAGVALRTMDAHGGVMEAQMLRSYPLQVSRGQGQAPEMTGRFILDLQTSSAGLTYGQPVSVRFDLGRASLAEQAWRAMTIWLTKISMSRYVEEPL